MRDGTMYAVYHRVCGHIAATPNERWMGEAFIAAMAALGQYQWRMRANATDEDLLALLRGDRCVLCRLDDPSVVPDPPSRES
jgi:hypothetical protein